MRIRISQMIGLALLLPGLVLAQQGTIRGTITDTEAREGLPGANILLVETRQGAASDIDGNYMIAGVPVGTYTLRVTFIGYKPVDRVITTTPGDMTIDVAMEPDYAGLEEVVVTGIASSRSKATAEVAVSRLNTEKLLEQNAYQDLSQMLNGKIAGVGVQPASGNVAGGIRFNVRAGGGLNGNGQPVIYVDGIRIDNSQVGQFGVGGQATGMLANLNPEEIESVEVLKGPAGAALYGTSGANGVVLIKTKKGSLNSGGVAPINVTYKNVLGVNQQADEYDAFNAASPETANAFFRDGNIVQHTISASGGNNFIRYFTSYDTRMEKGAIRNNKMERQNFRANFEVFPSEKITLRANAGYTLNDVNRPQNDNNLFGYLGNTLLSTRPFNFTDSTAIEALKSIQRIAQFLGSVEASYSPIKNLEIKGSIGYDGSDIREDQTRPSNERYSGTVNGRRNAGSRRNQQVTYDLNARYGYRITDWLSANSIVGGQAFNRELRSFFIQKENFQTELITNVGAGSDFLNGDETFLQTREAGLFAQQEFNVQNRIFASFGVRRDFASAVGARAPNIFYPKASMAIRVDQFDLLPRQINFFKVRVAYGETGVLPNLLDASGLRWTAEPSGYGAGAVLGNIGNLELEPERVKEIEFGFEAGLFNDVVGIDFTYYRQNATSSIISFRNAPSTGLTASDVPFNVGEIQGWGFEAALSVAPLRTRNYGIDLHAIWNFQDNEVKDLGGAQPIFDAFDTNVIKEGLPRSAFFHTRAKPVFDENGVYSGAVEAETEDRVMLGRPTPLHSGSFSVNFRFLRHFNLYALADWSLDLQVLNSTRRFAVLFGGDKRRNDLAALLGLSEQEGVTPLTPGTPEYVAAAEEHARTNGSGSFRGNFIEDADFLKLREVSIQYDLASLINRLNNGRNYFRMFRVALAARNLWMTTLYSGVDPEVNFRGARDLSQGQDFLTLPQPRQIYFTLTVGI